MRAPILVALATIVAGCLHAGPTAAPPEATAQTDELEPASAAPAPEAPPASVEFGSRVPRAAPAPSPVGGPFAVVAFVDSGINPYHAAFRDASPRASAHPSTYLPGFPPDAEAIRLTFDHANLTAAFAADCAEWAKVQPGTLYWFPGTRVVGAIEMDDPGEWACGDADDPYPARIFGTSHGTMVASRAAGVGYGACPECLVVMVRGHTLEAVAWPAEQPWIDAQSNSWGPVAFAWAPSGRVSAIGAYLVADPPLVREIEAAAARQPSFWAAGNGALGRFGGVGHPSELAPHLTPSVIRVGGHDTGRITPWPGWSPHVVSDACDSWAAEHATLDESTPATGGGTSGATPFAAGLAGELVLEARRLLGDARTGVRDGVLAEGDLPPPSAGPLADGNLTVAELREALLATADPRPKATEEDGAICEVALPRADGGGVEVPLGAYVTAPVAWAAVPADAPAWTFVGYGAVTRATADAAKAILRGEAPLPERAEDAWFEQDDKVRRATYEVWSR